MSTELMVNGLTESETAATASCFGLGVPPTPAGSSLQPSVSAEIPDAEQFAVGDHVTLKANLYEPADDHAPGGYLAMRGDRLIVRAVRNSGRWPISVSHDDRTDGITFGVAAAEIEPREGSLPDRAETEGLRAEGIEPGAACGTRPTNSRGE